MEHESCTKTCKEKSMAKSHRKTDGAILKETSQKQRATTAYYDKIMKESRDFYNELDHVTIQVPKREIAGPPWYQDLSVYQINILNDLKNHIKNDFDDSNTKRARRALNELGIQTKIPHSVAKNAILRSKLYSINFLQIILEYLRNKINHNTKRTEPLKYTTEERILVSGIVHLGLPSLFMKLDYCLSGSITKKNQPSNLNAKALIKKHDSSENIIKEKKTKQDIIVRSIDLITKNTDPMHPLDTLFVQLPLDILFEDKKHDNMVVEKKMAENKVNEEIERSTLEVPNVMTNKDFIYENASKAYNDVTNNKKNTTENDEHFSTNESSSFQTQKHNKFNHDQFDTVLIPSSISNLASLGNCNSYDNRYLNFTPLIHLKKSILFKHIEYEEVDEESETEDTVEDEDFSFLVDCSQEENEHDVNVILKTDIEQFFVGKYSNIDKSQFSEKLNSNNVSTFLEISPMTSIMDNQSKIEDSMIRMFNYQKHVFRDYQLHSIGVKMPQQDNKHNVYGIGTIDKKEIKNGSLRSTNVTPKAELNFGNTSNTTLNTFDSDAVSKQRESENSINYEATDQTHVSNMRQTHIYDEILENIQKLSKWKKLKTVLEFLAILGDPIASLPNVIKLHVVRHWYVSRLNTNNRQLTAKQKAELLNSSKKLWRSPKSRVISVPKNPLSTQEHCARLTWDSKNMVVKKINEVKDIYTNKFKERALKYSREILYPTFKTAQYKNQLNEDFKRTYYSYFPAKAADVIWR